MSGNLVLRCVVIGASAINWYKEDMLLNSSFVTSSGTLIMNLTEDVNASPTGTPYHCSALQPLILSDGSESIAILRSREVYVVHTCK